MRHSFAVYIAGPDFGARKAAGNSFEDIGELCEYAHKYGARVFVTYNTVVSAEELPEVHRQMLLSQELGADAFIIRDIALCRWDDITVPLHASTQCAIRSSERALQYFAAGCSRVVLERELSLSEIREICTAVAGRDVEVFVHGALCVCYSGECRLSERINGRSADRGECIQACRSLYDLVDERGRVLLKDKALLSLRDYNFLSRIGELAEAGVCSFKIEGRLKNASYVKNCVRAYDLALNEFISKHPQQYARASFGRVEGGFVPDLNKTFNRGYTELYLDGKRHRPWSSMDAPKSMGERLGTIERVTRRDAEMELRIRSQSGRSLSLRNGDGFAFTVPSGVVGFRGDVCEGLTIRSKNIPEIKVGTVLFRNINAAFEKTLESSPVRREIAVELRLRISGKFKIEVFSHSEDGREQTAVFNADVELARDSQRETAILREQLSKRSSVYKFTLGEIILDTPGGSLPLLSVSTINSIRRAVASDLDSEGCRKRPLAGRENSAIGSSQGSDMPLPTDSYAEASSLPLMRSRYCVRFELGMCPVMQGATPPKQLYILNNGRKFALNFDCKACEMTLSEAQS